MWCVPVYNGILFSYEKEGNPVIYCNRVGQTKLLGAEGGSPILHKKLPPTPGRREAVGRNCKVVDQSSSWRKSSLPQEEMRGTTAEEAA